MGPQPCSPQHSWVTPAADFLGLPGGFRAGPRSHGKILCHLASRHLWPALRLHPAWHVGPQAPCLLTPRPLPCCSLAKRRVSLFSLLIPPLSASLQGCLLWEALTDLQPQVVTLPSILMVPEKVCHDHHCIVCAFICSASCLRGLTTANHISQAPLPVLASG